ncbi:Zinc finger protein 24, partial [Dissostichus eleginoides]
MASRKKGRVGPSNADVVNICRDFIAAQQRRDDILQEEIRGLRVSVEAFQQPVHRHQGDPHVDFGPSLMSSPDRFGNPSGGVVAVHPMDEDMSNCYPELREALLVKFDISPETYRQRFRATSSPPGETPTESYHRLKGLYRRWMRPEEKSKEQMGETIILEQLLQVLPPDTRTWVKEHEPEDGLTASKLAMQFLNARKGATPRPTRDETRDWNDQRDNFPRTGQ